MASLAVIRLLPALARPAVPTNDCESVSRTDASALERCLAVRPDDVELMLDLAGLREQAGDRPAAMALYRRALMVDPDDGEVRRKLGGDQ